MSAFRPSFSVKRAANARTAGDRPNSLIYETAPIRYSFKE